MVIQDKIEQLRLGSLNKRIAHLPNVLSSIEICLSNPKIIDNIKTFDKLAFALWKILEYEQKHSLPNSEKIIKSMKIKILKKVINLVYQNSEYPTHYTVTFLRETGEEEVVDVFYEKIGQKKWKNAEIDHVARALGSLYYNYHKRINNHQTNLIKSGDPELIEHAKTIRGYLI